MSNKTKKPDTEALTASQGIKQNVFVGVSQLVVVASVVYMAATIALGTDMVMWIGCIPAALWAVVVTGAKFVK